MATEHPLNPAPAASQGRVDRPWGSYACVQSGPGFQVKHITVNPGGQLSLQKHAHRAEHWVVVSGVADVHLDGARRELKPKDSVFIALGAVHRLSNPIQVPLEVIEVQFGHYLGEDDIVRFEDVYGRV